MLQSFRVEPGIDYIKLPCLKRTELGDLGVRFLDLDVSEIVRLRRELILSTVMSYRPDVVLVDKKPDGLAGELEPSLRHIKCSLSQTRMYLVLRDILDSSSATVDDWTRRGYYDVVRWFYDGVLVLGDRSIFDVCEEYQFPPGLREKVHHCGYVQRQPPGRPRCEIRSELGVGDAESLVLVTAGGGEDGYEMFSASLAATSSLGQRLPLKTVLVTGPELDAERTQVICKAAQSRNDLRLIEFTDDLMSYMSAADVVISRAERLAGFGAFRIILPDELKPSILERAIEEDLQLAHSPVPVPACIDLGALPRIITILQSAAPRTVCNLESEAIREMLAPTGSEW